MQQKACIQASEGSFRCTAWTPLIHLPLVCPWGLDEGYDTLLLFGRFSKAEVNLGYVTREGPWDFDSRYIFRGISFCPFLPFPPFLSFFPTPQTFNGTRVYNIRFQALPPSIHSRPSISSVIYSISNHGLLGGPLPTLLSCLFWVFLASNATPSTFSAAHGTSLVPRSALRLERPQLLRNQHRRSLWMRILEVHLSFKLALNS